MEPFCPDADGSNILQFDRPADFYYRMARSKFGSGDIPGAIARARTAAQKAPEDEGSQLLLAELLLAAQRADRAILVLFNLLDSIGSEDAECSFLLGIASALLSDVRASRMFLDLYLDSARNRAHIPLAQCVKACLDMCGSGHVPKSFRTVISSALMFVASVQAASGSPKCPEYTVQQTHRRDMRGMTRQPEYESGIPALVLPIIAIEPAMMPHQGTADDTVPSDEMLRAATWQFVRLHEAFARAVRELQSEGRHDRLYQLFDIFHNATVASGYLLSKGLAAYNTGHRAEAVEILSDVCKIDSDETVGEHYLRLINRTEPGSERPLPYLAGLPIDTAHRYTAFLNACSTRSDTELLGLWSGTPMLPRAVRWSILHGPESTLCTSCSIAVRLGAARTERIVRLALLRSDCSDTAKEMLVSSLRNMNAEHPYYALSDERIVEYDSSGMHTIVPAAKVRAQAVARLIGNAAEQLGRPELGWRAHRVMNDLRAVAHLSEIWHSSPDAAAACLLAAAHSGLSTNAEISTICRVCGAQPDTARSIAQRIHEELRRTERDE